MDRYLFYMYLEYLKDNDLTFWSQMWKQPKKMISLLIAVCVLGAISIILSFFDATIRYAFIAAIFEFGTCIVLYFYTEHYKITCSKKRADEYRDYCEKIKKWLVECNIKTEVAIKSLLDRVNKSIEEIESLDKDSQLRTDKWLQALVIPVLLAIITTVLNTNSDMEVMISGTITIIICFIALYCGYTGVRRIANFPNKRMYQQLKCFASDLQGVWDTQFSNSIFK